MTDLEQLIKSAIGDNTISFEYVVATTKRRGWKKYVLNESGHGDPDDPAVVLVDQTWRAMHDNDIRLFVGPSVFRIGPNEYADSLGEIEYDSDDGIPAELLQPARVPPTCSMVFALPGLAVLDIIEFCKTGSHNAPSGPSKSHGSEPWRIVRNALSRVMEIAPFEVQFADAAGLRATMLDPITPDEAKVVGNLICEVAPESGELPIQELRRLGHVVPMDREAPDCPDYEAAMTEFMTLTGQFRLWWD